MVGSLPVTMLLRHPRERLPDRAQQHGQAVETWSGPDINGPWDLTAQSFGDLTQLFVTNVLNGTVTAAPGPTNQGTVVRLDVWTATTRRPRCSLRP